MHVHGRAGLKMCVQAGATWASNQICCLQGGHAYEITTCVAYDHHLCGLRSPPAWLMITTCVAYDHHLCGLGGWLLCAHGPVPCACALPVSPLPCVPCPVSRVLCMSGHVPCPITQPKAQEHGLKLEQFAWMVPFCWPGCLQRCASQLVPTPLGEWKPGLSHLLCWMTLPATVVVARRVGCQQQRAATTASAAAGAVPRSTDKAPEGRKVVHERKGGWSRHLVKVSFRHCMHRVGNCRRTACIDRFTGGPWFRWSRVFGGAGDNGSENDRWEWEW